MTFSARAAAPSLRILSAIALVSTAGVARAQVDNLAIVVNAANAVGNSIQSNIAAFGYDPLNNKVYVAGDFTTGQDIRVVSGIDGTLGFQRLVTATPWQRFTKDGDLSRGGGTPTPGSLLLNPVAIGSVPAYSVAVITDRPGVVSTGGVDNPDLTRLVYRYNLGVPVDNDARSVFTSLATLQQYREASGVTSTSNSNFSNRQVAYGSDAATVYFVDSSAGYRGLWSVPTLGGTAPTRILADPDLISEPTVVRRDGVDRVYVDGTLTSNNAGGIDAYDPASGTRTSVIAAADVASFLETTADNIDIRSLASDAAGNVYFNQSDSAPDRRGIFKLDPQGRLIKVISRAERAAFTGLSVNNETPRMQPRTATYAGPNGTFSTTQVLYMERAPVNAVAGAWVFKPGDFDHDNDVDLTDVGLFEAKITPRGVAAPVADGRYDLNGNNVIDWKDVKVLQTFLAFPDGDADFDFAVSFPDLVTLAQNYGAPAGKTWRDGDFTGDDAVGFADLVILAQNYNDRTTPPGGLTGIGTVAFAADWARAQALVPEPAVTATMAAATLFAARRRRDPRATHEVQR